MRNISTAGHSRRTYGDLVSELDFLPEPVGDSPVLETFRLLAIQVERMLPQLERRSILILSARPGEGRSLVASGLARALTALVAPVVLIDADTIGSGGARNGAMPTWPVDGALSHAVNAVVSEPHPRLAPISKFQVAAGQRSQLQTVDDITRALDGAAANGAVAVIDTPACLSSSLALSLVGRVGGVIYVARKRVEDASTHREIRGQLDLLGAKVLGVVFNEG
ncbi:MAG TPA: hypothetical protein VG015_08980 [Candidatus Dormibacteraeota bacterium]|jgi:hypothetical protein|nr:hypothetical protein [Candidatus Dormibacteraeota bacterium]